jgi:hypothetical protein
MFWVLELTSGCTQAPSREDTLRAILSELEGVPTLGSDNELHDARDKAITLELTNRFAVVNGPFFSPHKCTYTINNKTSVL